MRIPMIGLVFTLLAGAAAAQPPPGYGDALRDLDRARRNLDQALDATQRARGDFGGHRARAIDLMRRAHRELNEAARQAR